MKNSPQDIDLLTRSIAILKQEFYKVWSINLTKNTITEFIDEINITTTVDIQDVIIDFHQMYTLVQNKYNHIENLSDIKDHFMKSDEKLAFRLQKKDNNNHISWMSVSIYKSSDYTPHNQNLVMLVRHIDDEYRDMILKQQELEELSYTDNLTDVGNRRAFDDFIKSNDRHLGIIFIDLNGLKKINDTKGHRYGDLLIQNCSRSITKFFRKSDCYRIGGDEFIIVLEDITETLLITKLNLLKDECIKNDVSISIGVEWNGGSDIEKLVHKAEKRMREDKDNYYKTHERYR